MIIENLKELPEKWYLENNGLTTTYITKYRQIRGITPSCLIFEYTCVTDRGYGNYIDKINSQEISLAQFKKWVLKEELDSKIDSWVVKLTEENRDIVEKWARSINPEGNFSFCVGYSYGYDRKGDFFCTSGNPLETVDKIISTEEFKLKIGLTKEKIIPEYVECIKSLNNATLGKIYPINGEYCICEEGMTYLWKSSQFKPSTKEAFEAQNKSKQLEFSDLIEGEVYTDNEVIFIPPLPGIGIRLKGDHFLYKNCWALEEDQLKQANKLQIKHLQVCIKADKFIPELELDLYDDITFELKPKDQKKSDLECLLETVKKTYPIGTKFKCAYSGEVGTVKDNYYFIGISLVNDSILCSTEEGGSKYLLYMGQQFAEKITKSIPLFEKGKWYKTLPEENNRGGEIYYGKLKEYRDDIFTASEYTVNKNKISRHIYSFCSGYKWTLLTDLTEIQQFLPKGHVDLLVKEEQYIPKVDDWVIVNPPNNTYTTDNCVIGQIENYRNSNNYWLKNVQNKTVDYISTDSFCCNGWPLRKALLYEIPNKPNIEEIQKICKEKFPIGCEFKGDTGIILTLKEDSTTYGIRHDRIYAGSSQGSLYYNGMYAELISLPKEKESISISCLKVSDKISFKVKGELFIGSVEKRNGGYYLLFEYTNAIVFNKLGIDKELFQKKILGYSNLGGFPYCETLKDLEVFIKAIQKECRNSYEDDAPKPKSIMQVDYETHGDIFIIGTPLGQLRLPDRKIVCYEDDKGKTIFSKSGYNLNEFKDRYIANVSKDYFYVSDFGYGWFKKSDILNLYTTGGDAYYDRPISQVQVKSNQQSINQLEFQQPVLIKKSKKTKQLFIIN